MTAGFRHAHNAAAPAVSERTCAAIGRMRNRARSVHRDDVTAQPPSGSIVGMSNPPAPRLRTGPRRPTASATARVTALWSFTGKYRILHLTWIAFFLSFVVWFNYAPFANTIAEQLGLTEAEEKTIALVQRRPDHPRPDLHRDGARPMGPAPGVRGDPHVRRHPEHGLRAVELADDARAQPPRAVGRRRRLRRRHPHGVGVVPAEGGRNRRGRVRRMGQLRCGGRRVLAPDVRRAVRRRRRMALVDPAHRCDRRRLRPLLPDRGDRHPRGRLVRPPAAPGCARGDEPQGGVRAGGADGAAQRRARPSSPGGSGGST